MISARFIPLFVALAVFSSAFPRLVLARSPEAQACVDSWLHQGRPFRVELNHRFPMSHSQGENGTCYAHALLAGLSAIQQQDFSGDSSTLGDPKAYVREFDYSPELTLLLLALVDDEFIRERIESSRRFSKTALFDNGFASRLYARIKLYPQALISVPNDLKLSLFSSVRGALLSAFEKVTDLGPQTTIDEVRDRIRAVLPPVFEAAQKKPELAGFVAELRKKGWSWNSERQVLKNAQWLKWLPYSMRVISPKTMNECLEMKGQILTSLCEGKPVVISFADWSSNGSIHATVVSGVGRYEGKVVLMMRDSKFRNREGTISNPHQTLKPFPLDQACQLSGGQFTLFRTEIFEGLALENQQ